MSKNKLDNLNDTSTGIFYFVQYFRDNLKLDVDSIQDVDSVTCDVSQIYFTTICLITTKTAKYKTKLN